jgi:hypothetical protein
LPKDVHQGLGGATIELKRLALLTWVLTPSGSKSIELEDPRAGDVEGFPNAFNARWLNRSRRLCGFSKRGNYGHEVLSLARRARESEW